MKKYSSILLTACLLLATATTRAQSASPTAMLKAADSLFTKQSWKAAKERYQAYLKDTSTNALAWNRLGYSNHSLGLYDEALKDYQRALDNKPSPMLRTVVAERTARIYSVQNKIAEAGEWLGKTGGTGYNVQADVDTMADFNNLRKAANYTDIKKKLYVTMYPCAAEPHAHDFDFWLGEWDVYQTGGAKNLVGHSLIQTMAGDCAILENWTSVQAHNGKSFNYYDGKTGKWQQDWIGSGGASDHSSYVNGEYKDGVMAFTNEATDAQGHKTMNNFKFYNIDANTVRQYLETSADGGKSYTPVYDFTYKRKK